jgi:hypothetical protein
VGVEAVARGEHRGEGAVADLRGGELLGLAGECVDHQQRVAAAMIHQPREHDRLAVTIQVATVPRWLLMGVATP